MLITHTAVLIIWSERQRSQTFLVDPEHTAQKTFSPVSQDSASSSTVPHAHCAIKTTGLFTVPVLNLRNPCGRHLAFHTNYYTMEIHAIDVYINQIMSICLFIDFSEFNIDEPAPTSFFINSCNFFTNWIRRIYNSSLGGPS